MIYGDPERFAAEWMLDEEYGGTWMFGRIRYWVGGVQVGDWLPGAILSDAWETLRYPVWDSGKRRYDELHALPAEEVVQIIQRAHREGDETARKFLGDDYAKFIVNLPPDEGFHGWALYMTEDATGARLVLAYQPLETFSLSVVKEQFLRRGEFDAIVTKMQSDLEETWQRERDLQLRSEGKKSVPIRVIRGE